MQSKITPLYFFLAQASYTFAKSSSLKFKFLRFLSARIKIHQITQVNVELTSQLLFKFCIILYSQGKQLPYKFQAHTFSTLDKRTQEKSQFLDFQTCFDGNLPNYLCHFRKYNTVFLQILHQSALQSKKPPLYFFSSNII